MKIMNLSSKFIVNITVSDITANNSLSAIMFNPFEVVKRGQLANDIAGLADSHIYVIKN
ncbi:hypothetical protein ACRN9C_11735 [Shewanella frigidimarina]|uniref:hypothetical protein n=1 Tax=Shewanella frigidimarina TaxID=56812 RepID=UPI003D7B4E65